MAALIGEVGAGAGAAAGLALVAVMLLGSRLWRWRAGYSGLRTSGGGGSAPMVRVVFELGDGLREDAEVGLGRTRSVNELRLTLLQLADELLLDPEDDLGEWTLRYTDKAGLLQPVPPAISIRDLGARATELRVTAGPSLRARAT